MSSKLEILFLSDKQVNSLGGANMAEVMEDMRNVLSIRDKGDFICPDKAVMRWGHTVEDENTLGRINAMPGYVGGDYNMAGIKWIGSNPKNYLLGFPRATVLVVLNDPITKIPVAVADGTTVSAKRTGAVSGLAIDYLSRKDAKSITMIGAGAQGRTQLEAALVARPGIEELYIYDLMFDRAQQFASEMSEKLGKKVIAVEKAEEAASKSDIIITATIACEPIVFDNWLKPGSLYLNIADYECTYETVKKCDKIIVDTWEGVKHRKISTVSLMYADGLIKDSDIHAELGEIINGKKTGRENNQEIIYFNAVGMGIEDIAVITRVYKKALKLGVGTKVPYWED